MVPPNVRAQQFANEIEWNGCEKVEEKS